MTSQLKLQIGKKGLSEEFISELKNRFDKQRLTNIKISVLKSAREDREDIKKYAEQLKHKLGNKFTFRIIGFSIFIKKWRKARVS